MSETDSDKQTIPHLEEVHQHMKAARQALRKSFEAWLPDGFLEHRRAARKEMLQAMRSLIDAAIDRMEKPND